MDAQGRRTGTVPTDAFAESGGRDVELERAALVDLPLVAKAQASVSRGAGMLVPATAAAIWRRNQLTKLIPLALATRRVFRR